jgi:hypothetical protein
MRKITYIFLLVLAIAAGTFSIAYAHRDFMEKFNDTYGTRGTPLDTCITCHSNILNLNPYGEDFRDNGSDFAAIEQMDSDDDGFSNIDEINARSLPGDSGDVPSSGDSGCFIATAAYATPVEPPLSLGPVSSLALVLLFGTGLIVLVGFMGEDLSHLS